MKNKYSIKEVAEIFNITANKIRFYEKKGLLKPLRENNEYRIFTKDDILKLQSILLYRAIGMPITTIKNILNTTDKNNYLNCFNTQWTLVNDEIQKLSIIRDSLGNILDNLYNTKEELLDDSIFSVINESNNILSIKNNWTDKWNFDSWAKTYDTDIIKDPTHLKMYKNYNLLLDTVHELALNSAIYNPNILDIGVGTGNLAKRFFNDDCNLIGIDQSREMLTIAKNKFPNLKVRLGEFLKIPFPDESFHIIVSTYAFHHLNSKEKSIAIKEMLRVLKDDGYIIIGDLMFENEKAKKDLLKTLNTDEINEINNEFFSSIDFLNSEFKKYNKNLTYTKIDRINFIIFISNV